MVRSSLLATAAACSSIAFAFAQPAPPAPPKPSADAVLSQKSPDAGDLATIAKRDGKVRVIVLVESPASTGRNAPDGAAAAKAKEGAKSVEEAVIAQHFGSASSPSAGKGFERNLTRQENPPGFAVTVSLIELQALAGDARVLSISQDRAAPPAAK